MEVMVVGYPHHLVHLQEPVRDRGNAPGLSRVQDA